MSCFDTLEATRLAIQEALPDWDQAGDHATLPIGFTYLPQSHALALEPDATIVSGMRGAGKSHWYSYLADEKVRSYLLGAYRNLRITPATDVRQCFGAGSGGSTPSPDTFKRLAAIDADAAWKCLAANALRLGKPFPLAADWQKKTLWIKDNPERFEELLRRLDELLVAEGKTILLLFDALDRIADDWKGIRLAANRLFRLALELRSYRALRMKLFVRPDMLEDEAILAFPDASKLMARRVDLTWNRLDLYAVFYQRLGNTSAFGKRFVEYTEKHYKLVWGASPDGTSRVLPEELRFDEELQAKVFRLIAGKAMAGGESGHKRGIPYSWLVNHLVDARDEVSPRSFFAALVTASRTANDPSWGFALDPRSIQNGVVKASTIRSDEIAREDYPWVSVLMRPLGERRLIIPCKESEIRAIWKDYDVSGSIGRMIAHGAGEVKLPPAHLEDGPRGLVDDLVGLGIMHRLMDGRIQVPDVYRIAYGLGRLGGVKPLK